MLRVWLFSSALIAVWALLALTQQRKLPQEYGLTPEYNTTCAGILKSSFGILTGTAIPFWRISLYESFAVIVVLFPIAINYSDFDSVKCSTCVIFKVVTFRSRKLKLDFSAWVLSSRPMTKILVQHGVRVSGYGVGTEGTE
jgi:hypothetical protein